MVPPNKLGPDLNGKAVPIFCDNTSAIAISDNPVLHSRTKHIDIKYHFIRDHILKGDIELHFIPTQYQLVDIFTKPLDEPTFKRLIVGLVMLNINSKPEPLVLIEETTPWPVSYRGGHASRYGAAIAHYLEPWLVDSQAPKTSSQTEKVPQSKNLGVKMVSEIHKEARQEAGGPTSLGATIEKGARPQLINDMSAFTLIKPIYSTAFIFTLNLHQEGMVERTQNYSLDHKLAGTNPSVLVDKTKSARDGLKTAHTDSGTNKESRADENSKKIKLEDLLDLMKDTRSAFLTSDSPHMENVGLKCLQESRADENSKKIKLEDLLDLMKDTR
ncbi:hypothetical protein Tco_1399023, partial [Tanacetum coccineum]